MRILFCNIGWMEDYQGQTTSDKIQVGGSYVKQEGMGHEICNFVEHEGIVYGYVQPLGNNGGSVNLKRINKN